MAMLLPLLISTGGHYSFPVRKYERVVARSLAPAHLSLRSHVFLSSFGPLSAMDSLRQGHLSKTLSLHGEVVVLASYLGPGVFAAHEAFEGNRYTVAGLSLRPSRGFAFSVGAYLAEERGSGGGASQGARFGFRFKDDRLSLAFSYLQPTNGETSYRTRVAFALQPKRDVAMTGYARISPNGGKAHSLIEVRKGFFDNHLVLFAGGEGGVNWRALGDIAREGDVASIVPYAGLGVNFSLGSNRVDVSARLNPNAFGLNFSSRW